MVIEKHFHYYNKSYLNDLDSFLGRISRCFLKYYYNLFSFLRFTYFMADNMN